jgi:KDO2-lipid IV(A) lauroyltransferase
MAWFFALLPRRATVLLADMLGLVFFHVLRMRRSVVEENLAIAFGQTKSAAERRRIALRTYQNSILTLIEFVQPKPFLGGQSRFHSVHGAEQIDKVRESGALVLTAHMGNWEALPAYATQQGVPLTALIKPLHNPLVNRDVLRRRSGQGLEVLATTDLMKAAVSAHRRGRWLTFLSDQDARRQGIFVDFFGQPASTAPGVAYFSWRLKLPILPVFCTRDSTPRRDLVIHVCPPLFPDPSQPRDQEELRLTKAHVQALEQIVARYPEHYFWFHRRWKTRPKKARGKDEANQQRQNP